MPTDVARIQVRSDSATRFMGSPTSTYSWIVYSSIIPAIGKQVPRGERLCTACSSIQETRKGGRGGRGGGEGEVTEPSEYWLSTRASTSLKLLDCIRMPSRSRL